MACHVSSFCYIPAMQFLLLTPSKQLADVQASYIHITGEDGDFGVLPGHMPLVSTLRPNGFVKVTTAEGTQTFTISAGVAEVTPQSVTILAESAQQA